jgi:hypothetical protein
VTRPTARELCLAAALAASAALNVCLGCAADRHAAEAAKEKEAHEQTLREFGEFLDAVRAERGPRPKL